MSLENIIKKYRNNQHLFSRSSVRVLLEKILELREYPITNAMMKDILDVQLGCDVHEEEAASVNAAVEDALRNPAPRAPEKTTDKSPCVVCKLIKDGFSQGPCPLHGHFS